MRALTVTATVSPDHTLTLQVPEDVATGTHQVIVVFEGAPSPTKRGFFLDGWKPHDVGPVDPTCTYRREDMYGDDGR